jgi:hypothetical protein
LKTAGEAAYQEGPPDKNSTAAVFTAAVRLKAVLPAAVVTTILAITFDIPPAESFAVGAVAIAVVAGVIRLGTSAVAGIFLSSVEPVTITFLQIAVVVTIVSAVAAIVTIAVIIAIAIPFPPAPFLAPFLSFFASLAPVLPAIIAPD